jgi:hypothetical protein
MTGGTNGFVLQTDGTGNLSWTAQTGNGGGGNGTPGGANTQIQYNDSGSFGGNAGFTFDEVSGNVNLPANLIVAGTIYGNIANSGNSNFANYAGNVTVSAQPNITSVGSLANLTVTGNISAGNANVTGNISAGNANVTGNISAGNANLGNLVTAGFFSGNGSLLTGINGGNIIGIVANANYAAYAGNIIGIAANANYAAYAGNIITAAQPNITSTGNLVNLTVTGNATFNSPIFIESGSERFTANTGTPSGTVVLDISNSSTLYAISNNANANITLNITNISTASVANSSVVATYIYTNGANAYSINNLELDGTAVSIKWAGATPPTAYASSTMVYTFTILYIGGVGYDIIGTGTRYA